MKVKTEFFFFFYSLVFFTLLSFSYFSILIKQFEMLLWQLTEIKYFIYIFFLFFIPVHVHFTPCNKVILDNVS